MCIIYKKEMYIQSPLKLSNAICKSNLSRPIPFNGDR